MQLIRTFLVNTTAVTAVTATCRVQRIALKQNRKRFGLEVVRTVVRLQLLSCY
jgi:hypothetical protein